MTTVTSRPWELLFPPLPPGTETVTLNFRLLRKQGQPLLLVPPGGSLLAPSLSLYPAQSRKARLARALAAFGLRARLPVLTEAVTISCERNHPFLRFLNPASTSPGKAVTHFTVFFCNPRPGGQRFILLTFDQHGQPTRVIKAGAGEGAADVIQRELNFLRQLESAGLRGIPKVSASFDSPPVKAVALNYVSGVTPRAGDLPAAGEVLTPWLQPGGRMPLRNLNAWQQLGAASTDPLVGRLEALLADTPFLPAIHHGDFAPWNIRLNRATGEWFVLDWERGEMSGPPGWDWFHLLIQPAILVQNKTPDAIAREVEDFLNGGPFGRYARMAGIEKCAKPWLLAYLLHARDVVKPAEGRQATTELLDLLRRSWLPG